MPVYTHVPTSPLLMWNRSARPAAYGTAFTRVRVTHLALTRTRARPIELDGDAAAHTDVLVLEGELDRFERDLLLVVGVEHRDRYDLSRSEIELRRDTLRDRDLHVALEQNRRRIDAYHDRVVVLVAYLDQLAVARHVWERILAEHEISATKGRDIVHPDLVRPTIGRRVGSRRRSCSTT